MADPSALDRLSMELTDAVQQAAGQLAHARRSDGAAGGDTEENAAAAEAARLAPLSALLAAGAEADRVVNGMLYMTPLTVAVRAGDAAAALLLLASRRSTGALHPDLHAELLAAALATPHAVAARLLPALLAAGCSVAAPGSEGGCALHAAVRANSVQGLLLLLAAESAPAALAVRDWRGSTPLLEALFARAPAEAVLALLRAPGGASVVNTPDHQNMLPLGLATHVTVVAALLAAGADADALNARGTPLAEQLLRRVPGDVILATLRAGARAAAPNVALPLGDVVPLRLWAPLALTLGVVYYWTDPAGQGPAVCDALLAALRSERAPPTPPGADAATHLWKACAHPAAVAWLAASACAPRPRAGIALLCGYACRGVYLTDVAIALVDVAGARLVDADAAADAPAAARREAAAMCMALVDDYPGQAATVGPMLAALVAATAADGGGGAAVADAIVAGLADAAAATAAAHAAADAEDAAREAAAVGGGAMPPAAAVATLHDFIQVATRAVDDADAYTRSVALMVLRTPPPDAPRLCAALLSVVTAFASAAPPPQAEHLRVVSAMSSFDTILLRDRARAAASMAAAAVIGVPQEEEKEEVEVEEEEVPLAPAPDASRHVTLLCAHDGASVCAPASALLALGVLRRVFDFDADAAAAAQQEGGAALRLPPLPVAGAQLTLLLACLEEAPPHDTAAAATLWLAQHRSGEEAAVVDEPASLPLLRLLLAADALDAPPRVVWAIAAAAARTLLAEGSAALLCHRVAA
jgi:hypothetical protein